MQLPEKEAASYIPRNLLEKTTAKEALETRDAVCVGALLLMEENALRGSVAQSDAWTPLLAGVLLLMSARGTVCQLCSWRSHHQRGWVAGNQTSFRLFGSM